MSHRVKPFAELSWQVVALDTMDNQDLPLQLLASSPPGTPPDAAIPYEAARQRRGNLFAQIGAWHHGGLNE